jgi:predicted membrane-bound spermidine synthase
MTETTTRNLWAEGLAAMKANFLLPGGDSGDVSLREIIVSEEDASFTRIRAALRSRGYVPAGTYTALYRRGGLWMSNTPDERHDHVEAVSAAYDACRYRNDDSPVRALVGGLGIGMVVAGMLAVGVKHIDVVEIDPDVIALVGPKVQALAAGHGATVTIHEADVFKVKWPKGTRWDVVWMDVWQNLSTDNLPEMTRLARSYGRRAGWQGYWGRSEIIAHRRRYGW